MKKVVIFLLAIVAPILICASISSVNDDSVEIPVLPGSDISYEAAPDDDMLDWEIIVGTTTGEPRSLFKPVRTSFGQRYIGVKFYVEETFVVKVKELSTGEFIENVTVDASTTSEIFFDMIGWNEGNYTIYMYREKTNQTYYGSFTKP